MKPVIYLLLPLAALFAASVSLSAKDRLVEKSGRTPDWIMSAGKDRFSVFAQADDMNLARDKCLEDIKQYIVNSIAANVVSVEHSTVDSRNYDGLEEIYTTYSSDLRTAAAKLPFLTGISLSNAVEIYWEKYRRSSDKSHYYMYYVLYPFSRFERDRLIRKFLDYDMEKYNTFLAAKDMYGRISDVSQIDAGIRQLEPLLQYFFDGVRKKETETLLAAYRKAYSKISLVPGRHELGRFTYGLMLEGRDITCSVMPSLRSETAVALVVAPSDAGYELTYDYSLCYPSEDNYVLITYRFPGVDLKYRYEFDVREKEQKAMLTGVLDILAYRRDSTWKADVSVNVRSKTDGDFGIGDVNFSLGPSMRFNYGDTAPFSGRSSQILRFTVDLEGADASVPSRGMVSGTADVKTVKGTERITFTLPYRLEYREL